MPDQSPCPCRLVVADRARFSIVSHMCTEEEIRKTVDAYLLKYYGKPSPTTLASTGTVSKWQAQAQMLSRALPIDVVRVVGVHVREQAAAPLQKCVRGAAVRVPYWGQLPGLCDCDGNLVYL